MTFWCGVYAYENYSSFPIDFTNDIATMESLPSTKVCQNCLKAWKGRKK